MVSGKIKCFGKSYPSWVRGLKYSSSQCSYSLCLSYPSWVRGLKSPFWNPLKKTHRVVPFVGTWIEISLIRDNCIAFCVVPFVGTWIEIPEDLKTTYDMLVVPFVGTWIEIPTTLPFGLIALCRTLRGYVD